MFESQERGAQKPPRPAPEARPPAARSTASARPVIAAKPRPDARPLRIAYGMGAVAAASALATALVTPGSSAPTAPISQVVTVPADATPLVRHVTQYVKLKPGQTAPPQAVVKQAPAPKPRVVVVTTRQSGAKP